MARPKDPQLERAWRQRLQRHAAAGLTISAFCAREGVSCAAFHAWKRRLTAPPISTRPHPPRFVPIQLDPGSRAAERGVEIALPHQVRLHCDALPEPQWLARVLAALATLPLQEGTP